MTFKWAHRPRSVLWAGTNWRIGLRATAAARAFAVSSWRAQHWARCLVVSYQRTSGRGDVLVVSVIALSLPYCVQLVNHGALLRARCALRSSLFVSSGFVLTVVLSCLAPALGGR